MKVIATLLALAALAPASSVQFAEPVVFAPGVISTGQYESHPAFSRDGRTLLFVRSDANFSKWSIWESHLAGGDWSQPVPAPFALGDVAADPLFSHDDGRVYFISTRLAPGKTQKDLDIWAVERRGDGWGVPERLPEPINSPAAEWFPRLQPDGSLYFGSDRPGGHGGTDIYHAVRTSGDWRVTNLGPAVNGPGEEYEFEVAPNGRFAILMAAREADKGGDLYLVGRDGGQWTPPVGIGPLVNTPGLEVGPMISRDGRYLYFSSVRSTERLGDIYRTRIVASAAR